MEPHDEEVKRHIATLQSILQEKDTSLHHGDSSGLMEEEEPRKRSEKEGTEFLLISSSLPMLADLSDRCRKSYTHVYLSKY